MKRRTFLQATGALALPMIIPSGLLAAPGRPGPNDQLRIGVAGLGYRGQTILIHEMAAGARVVAISDCHLPRCEQMVALAAKQRPDLRPETWNKYQDIRTMLDAEKLDAVFVETTTHARVWCMMHALAAGCDVYGEKPLALTIAEGRILSNAATKLGRILQTGTQQRSMPINAYASKLVRDGAIGKIQEVIVYNFEGGLPWNAPAESAEVPQGLDWDLWTNQVEYRPYHPLLQGRWPEYTDYDDGGQAWGVTGFGTHSLDQVQCALGTDTTGPVEMWLEDKGTNGWPKVILRYANGTLLKLIGERHTHEDLGAIFHGENGNIEILRGHVRANPAELLRDAPPDTTFGEGESKPHVANFLDCVRTREKPAADAETGHRATTICHLVTICRTLGRKLQWDPQAETFVGDEEANRLLSRSRRAGYELPQIV
jgi:predicted dehydrogenase